MYYIGIDGGGAFTRLVSADENGKILAKHAGGSININTLSPETVKLNLSKILAEFFQLTGLKNDHCKGMVIGVHRKLDRDKLKMICEEIGCAFPVMLVTDLEMLLASQVKGDPGIVVHAHTNSIGFCKDRKNQVTYSGGFGRLLDEAGSNYWIGLRGIRTALMTLDGRQDQTLLVEGIMKQFKLERLVDILEYVYGEKYDRNSIATVAEIVQKAARENDAAAIGIEDAAAYELFLLAKGLMDKNKFPDATIVAAGSVFRGNQSIFSRMKQLIQAGYGEANVVLVSERPEIGGVYLAQSVFS